MLYLDMETYSELDLRKVGSQRYTRECSVLLLSWAVDDGPVLTWDATGVSMLPGALHAAFRDPTVELCAHNAAFDRNVLKHALGYDVPVERWHCTMAQALAHGLPGGLAALGDVFDMRDRKLSDGGALIHLFCKPQPATRLVRRATRETHPARWADFVRYCERDVVAMRDLRTAMPMWNYMPGSPERLLWNLDQRINDHGFAVDLELAQAAMLAAQVAATASKREVATLTHGAVASASQRDRLLEYARRIHGAQLGDLRAPTLGKQLAALDLPEDLRTLLELRAEAATASTAKYAAVVNAAVGGRLRGTMQWCGAARTGRWAHRQFQPGNLKRPDRDMPHEVVEHLTAATKAGVLGLAHAEPMRALANCVRGCIVAPPGSKLVISDLSNIEGRVLAWLADERWKLDAFASYDKGTGADLYKLAYSRAMRVELTDVGPYQRQIGKTMELALGYAGGVGAFVTLATALGLDLDELASAVLAAAAPAAVEQARGLHAWYVRMKRSTYDLEPRVWIACEVLKSAWREAHGATVALWALLQAAVERALDEPGVTHKAGRWLRVRASGDWVRVRLPSGRQLCYMHMQRDAGALSFMGVNQFTRKWSRLRTYGGSLVENACQAVARDTMALAMAPAMELGYQVVLTVHDELVTETADDDTHTVRELSTVLSTTPGWAPGLPLAAAGFETYRYRKG